MYLCEYVRVQLVTLICQHVMRQVWVCVHVCDSNYAAIYTLVCYLYSTSTVHWFLPFYSRFFHASCALNPQAAASFELYVVWLFWPLLRTHVIVTQTALPLLPFYINMLVCGNGLFLMVWKDCFWSCSTLLNKSLKYFYTSFFQILPQTCLL